VANLIIKRAVIIEWKENLLIGYGPHIF